jgi:integrase
MKDLTAKQVTVLRKPGKHRVSRNLYLQISEAGARSWLFRYMRHGKPHWHGLGSWDLMSLADARDKVLTCRKMLQSGIDPIEHERAQRMQVLLVSAATLTFRECGEAYLRSHDGSWRSDRHRHQWRASLATYVYPAIGNLPVQVIDVGLVLKAIEPIWHTKTETATRVLGRIEAILDWATVRGYRQGDNPARWRNHLDQLLPARAKLQPRQHFTAMPYTEVPKFVARLRERSGIPSRALEFTILNASRTAETLGATWAEIDLTAGIWTIPSGRIKAGREHRQPLSDRALEILRSLPREPDSPRVFISSRQGKPLAGVAMLRVLCDMGAHVTTHGFRAAFRTWAAEQTNFPRDLTEAALAHVVETRTGAAYQRGDLFEKRRRLMSAWARYCSTPRATGEVVPMARKG